MRIVITKNGKILVRELEDEEIENHEKQQSNLMRSSSFTKLPPIGQTNDSLFNKYKTKNNEFLNQVLRYRETFHSKRASSNIDKNALDSFYNRDESTININELNQARKIKVAHPKIIMSQAFIEKYDDFDLTFKQKIDDLLNGLNKSKISDYKKEDEKMLGDKNMDNNNERNLIGTNTNLESNYGINTTNGSGRYRKINLGQIISKNNLELLRKKISQYNRGNDDKRIPLNENNLRSYNFRSKFENRQATKEDMELILNYSINTDKQNIIKYFNQDKNISPQYF